MSDLLTWLPDDALVEALGVVPDRVHLSTFPLEGALPEETADIEVLVLAPHYRDRFAEAMPRLASLRVVQTLNAGVDWVPPLPESVLLCNASGVHDGPVAEWVVAAILAQQKRLPHFLDQQRAGHWDQTANLAFADGEPARDIDGSTVLVVGHGSIGRRLQPVLEALGATVIGIARHPRAGLLEVEDLPRLLPTADVVVLLAPATDETRGMVDEAFLAAMKPSALLVNAARGSLVDHDALLLALKTGRVRAVLDSTVPEPLPDGHELWSSPGLVVTPHVAGSSADWRRRAYQMVGDQLRLLALGEAPDNIRHHGY